MRKTFMVLGPIIAILLLTGSTNVQYHFTVSHYFEVNGSTVSTVVEKDIYAPAGTAFTIEAITDHHVDGYEDGIWENAYTSIDGGNSQMEENYDDVVFLPNKSTTIILIPDDTSVEFHYVYSANAHVKYEWENAPSSVTLPIDNKGYRDGFYTKDLIIIDETYKTGDVVIENNIEYIFSGWTKTKISNKIYLIKGSWSDKTIPQEEPKEENIPESPHTDIDI